MNLNGPIAHKWVRLLCRSSEDLVQLILNGYENIDCNFFFKIKEMKITRGHNFTLMKKQRRWDVRKYSFSQTTISISNQLSTDCVHASSVNVFKNIIDKYLVRLVTLRLRAGYTYNSMSRLSIS